MKTRVLASIMFLGISACGGGRSAAPETGQDAAAGTTSSGGATSGGALGSGGALATGGGQGSGGLVGGGGSGGSGGVTTTTGPAGTGGSTAKGGSTTTGTVTGTGGTVASGGSRASGGATGGTRASGGASGTGGVATTGGGSGTRDAGNVTDASGDGKLGTGGAGGAGAGGSTSTASTGAPETKPLGYGQNTTGGGSAAVVDVSSMAAMQAAIDAYSGSGGLSLRYTGKFNFSTITDPCTQWKLPEQIVVIKRKNDITIVGADGSAANFGFHIAAATSNIILRNMTIALLPGADLSDAIMIEGMSDGSPNNIWIDHNTLYSSMVACSGAGDTSFDGLLDVKKGADNVTISYNYIHDHHKVSLNGFTDSDTDTRHITFHHNIFQTVGSRTPMQRGGYSHMLNNLISGVTTSGINIRMNGHCLVEGNYFENAKNPVTSRDSAAIGFWELRGNNITSPADFTKFGITWSASSDDPTVDATDWKTTATFPVSLGYTYAVDPPDCLKSGLAAVAGAGKGLATLKCK